MKRPIQIRCERCNDKLCEVLGNWKQGEIRRLQCRTCGQPHDVAWAGGSKAYISAGIYQPIQPSLF